MQQKSPEQLIGNILAIAESGHGHLRVLVSEAATAIQSLMEDNRTMRAALQTIAASHSKAEAARIMRDHAYPVDSATPRCRVSPQEVRHEPYNNESSGNFGRGSTPLGKGEGHV